MNLFDASLFLACCTAIVLYCLQPDFSAVKEDARRAGSWATRRTDDGSGDRGRRML